MTLRTHCRNGHPLSGDNLIVRSNHGRDFRACRTCKRAAQADYLRRKPEKRNRPPDIGDQRRAVNLVGKQIARGTIVKGPCRDCGTTENVQGHHHRGYSGDAATDVVWLCAHHHSLEHRRLRLEGAA